jgi:hypothetical protein
MKRFLFILIALASFAAMASAQTNCVALQEIDGSPRVGCVKTIKVTNGTLSCSGSTCTITISGGGGSPGGSDTQLQYNNAGSFGGITGATTNGTFVTLTTPVIGAATGTSLTVTGNVQVGIAALYKFGSFNTLGYTDGLGPKFTDANTAADLIFDVQSLTASRTVTWPNASGTVAFTSGVPAGANPAASVGLTAVNGSATTYLRSDGAPALDQGIAPTWTGPHTFAVTARSSGVAKYHIIQTPADTGITASTESIGSQFGGNSSAATVTRQWATGALTTQRENVFVAPTYAFVGASTITTAATVSITGAPTAGTNATLTNALALNIEAGQTRFPAGTAAAPSISLGSNNYGFYRGGNAGNAIVAAVNGSAWVLFADANSGAAIVVDGSRAMGWGTASNGTLTAMFSGGGTANIRMGAATDVAAPVAQTLSVQNVVAGTTDTAGAAWTFNGSRGTGTGAGGGIIFQTAPATTTGNTQNALSEAFRINNYGGTRQKSVTFTNLPGSPTNGDVIFCSDCTQTSAFVDTTCVGSGSGAFAFRVNGAWKCFN